MYIPAIAEFLEKAAEVFDNDGRYSASLHLCQQFLNAGAIEVSSTVSIVNKPGQVREAFFSGVAFKDTSLIGNGITLPFKGIFLRKSAIKCCDFVGCP